MYTHLFPSPRIVLFLSLLIFVAVSTCYAVSDEEYRRCGDKLYSCGDVKDLRYPYYGGDRPEYCGREEFNLTCREDEYPIISIDNSDFRVHQVNQIARTMNLSWLFLEDDFCKVPDPQNTTLSVTRFQYGPDVKLLHLYYDCEPVNGTGFARKFSCEFQGRNRTGYFTDSSIEPRGYNGSQCTGIRVRVATASFEGIVNQSLGLKQALNRGFEVNYNEYYTNCLTCEGSKGICGSDSSGTNFICTLPSHKRSWLWLSIVLPIIFVSILAAVNFLWCMCCRNRNSAATKDEFARGVRPLVNRLHAYGLGNTEMLELNGEKDDELPFIDFPTIEAATGYFSDSNKIGRGGFGPIYKGKLVNGQEIAVKRLSRSSGQGLEEFKTEVLLISKLQHRNLVRLLGYSVQGEERILIYEYLPNKSLDTFLFDEEKRAQLDWKLRFCIIEGISQGLLYLHKYSRLRIIHRDLKTSNILLDSNMNPKISDFGTARVFGENESRANTQRIIGTYGYMSPEYAMDGLFSVKSDVYSFGVMMLEILSGKRNSLDFCLSGRSLNLLGYAWELWNEGQDFELMDPLLAETCSRNDAKRCVHIALLCVQESAADRPTMSDVLSMLGREMSALSTPKKPAFSATVSDHNDTSPGNPVPASINIVTMTEMEAR